MSIALLAGCTARVGGPDQIGTNTLDATRHDVGSLAAKNIGKSAGYCAVHPTKNSLGGRQFETSCSGNGGYGEYWCADFAKWVWRHAGGGGISLSGLTPAAGSFYVYGQKYKTLHTSHSYHPRVGDAVVYNYQGNGWAEHVGLVMAIHSDGSIQTANGDFGGQSGSEAHFAETSSVESVKISASEKWAGDTPSSIGMTISAYVSPHGLKSPGMRGAPFSLSRDASHVQVFARGPNGGVMRRLWTSSGWSKWQSLGTVKSGVASNLAGVSRNSTHMQVFARGSDNQLHHRWWKSGSGWSQWHSLGGDIRGTPAVVARDSNHMDVFARGPQGKLRRIWWHLGSGWSQWHSLGGDMQSDPAVVSRDSTRMEVFARGSDNHLHHRWWNSNGGWGKWHSLGGNIRGNPVVIARDSTHMQVFARGPNGGIQRILWHSGKGWSKWYSLGGNIQGDPAVVVRDSTHIRVFARGADNALHDRWWSTTNAWSKWHSLGTIKNGRVASTPAVVARDSKHMEVFVRGSDGKLHHRHWSSSGLWSGWSSLGTP